MTPPVGPGPAFAFPIRVYWEDTDAGGIVYYANYLKFFERARTEWLRSLGLEQHRLRQETGGIFVVGETSVRFHRAARLDDELLVTARVKEMGRASLIIVQQAFLRDGKDLPGAAGPIQRAGAPSEENAAATAASSGALLCEGTIRIGWVEAALLKPARIPPTILEALKR
ncbi:MAG TPA: YbgC/FadM family acyl-CoA thioesterase [Ramlibacter sp.]|nr:YbgC/FadM family acyl-CoA thioesterase [Ramlibacter sp.]